MNNTKSLTLAPENVVPASDKIYDVKEAAALLGCTERTLAELFKKGEIKATRKTGRWLTSYQNILDFVNK